jgi:hypothetical protein
MKVPPSIVEMQRLHVAGGYAARVWLRSGVECRGGLHMACRFTELIIDSDDPEALASFWSQVLEWETDESDGVWGLKPPLAAVPEIVFIKVPEKKSSKNRLHIDVSPTDRTRDEEVDRLLALGATRADVGQGDDVSWTVLTDPEGNEFCVLGTQVPADLAEWPWPETS